MQRQRIAVVLALVLIVSAVVPGAALGQTNDDESVADRLLGGAIDVLDDPGGAVDAFIAYGSGALANAKSRNPFREPKRTPTECAEDLQTEFNENSEVYLSNANSRLTASTDLDVLEIKCIHEDGDEVDTERVYLVATVNESTGEYESPKMVEETDRHVDETVRLSGLATEELPDDLERYREQYAEDDDLPPASFKREMIGKYGGHIEGTFEFLPEGE